MTLGVGALAPLRSFAQQPSKVWRIGYLGARSRSTPSNPDPYYDAFVRGMRDLGYVEGRNLQIEWRFADGKYDRLAGLAAELVRMDLPVIVTHSTRATEELQRATKTIPIITVVSDPIASGFAKSLARPDGNITGLSIIIIDTSAKQLELLKKMVPKLSRVALLMNPGNSLHPTILKNVQAAARQLGIKITPLEARNLEDIERGFTTLAAERTNAVIIASDGFFVGQGKSIAHLATKNRLASLFHDRENVMSGGLMSFGQNLNQAYRRAATYTDKILKGTMPGNLPIEQPTNVELVLNKKVANALGLKIPQELLLQANEVIE